MTIGRAEGVPIAADNTAYFLVEKHNIETTRVPWMEKISKYIFMCSSIRIIRSFVLICVCKSLLFFAIVFS